MDHPQAFRDVALKLSATMRPLMERDVNIKTTTAQGQKSDATGKKRKSVETSTAPNLDHIEIPDGTPVDWNANQIRQKIRRYLASGEMRVGQFQDELGVSAKGYGDFMKQNGPTKGCSSNTFSAAAEYFKKREIAGLAMPRKKKAKTAETGKEGKSAAKSAHEEKKHFDVSDIHLDGEGTDSVPIYDTCDEVRKKVEKHLRESSTSQIGFVRLVSDMFTDKPKQGLSTASLKTFLSARGPSRGSHMPVFYASYVFFEKLRVKHNKPKSKHREEMENFWGNRGMEKEDMTKPLWMGAGETLVTNQYGKSRVVQLKGPKTEKAR